MVSERPFHLILFIPFLLPFPLRPPSPSSPFPFIPLPLHPLSSSYPFLFITHFHPLYTLPLKTFFPPPFHHPLHPPLYPFLLIPLLFILLFNLLPLSSFSLSSSTPSSSCSSCVKSRGSFVSISFVSETRPYTRLLLSRAVGQGQK